MLYTFVNDERNHMHPKESRKLLKAGHITLEQHEANIKAYDALKAQEELKAETSKTEEFIENVEKASLAGKKRMLKEESVNQEVKALFEADRFDARERRKLAYGLKRSGSRMGISL